MLFPVYQISPKEGFNLLARLAPKLRPKKALEYFSLSLVFEHLNRKAIARETAGCDCARPTKNAP